MLTHLLLILFQMINSVVVCSEIYKIEQYVLVGLSLLWNITIFGLYYMKRDHPYIIRLILDLEIISIFSVCDQEQYLQFTFMYQILIRFILPVMEKQWIFRYEFIGFMLIDKLGSLCIMLILHTELNISNIIRSCVCGVLLSGIYIENKLNRNIQQNVKLNYSTPGFAVIDSGNQMPVSMIHSKSRENEAIGRIVLDHNCNILSINDYMNNFFSELEFNRDFLLQRIIVSKINVEARRKLSIKNHEKLTIKELLGKLIERGEMMDIMVIELKDDVPQLKGYLITIRFNENFEIQIQNMKERDNHQKREYLRKILKQLFSTFSHEFGTNLNYLLALSQVALEQFPERDGFFYPIKAMGEIMHHYVLDMVDFNDILTKTFQLQLQNIYIEQLVEDVISLFKDQITKKGLSIDYVNLCNTQILSDGRRIKQILINLISNAQKFTFNGGINILIKSIENNNFIQFEVSDTGIGIKEQEAINLEEVLRSNHKPDQQISDNTAGFGLGIYLSNKIAQSLSNLSFQDGGGLKFEKKAVGMRFYFKIRNSQFQYTQDISDSSQGISKVSKNVYIDLRQSQIDRSMNISKKFQKQASIFLPLWGRVQSTRFKDQDIIREISPLQNSRLDKQKSFTAVNINMETDATEFEYRVKQLDRKINHGINKEQPLPQFFKQQTNEKFETVKIYEIQGEQEECDCVPVLIVDDEMINILGLSILLNQFKIKSDSAYNGQEALDKVMHRQKAHCPYKAVFMDINMPIMDGFAATKAILNIQGRKPVIAACTAFTDASTKSRCYDIGMAHYLSKPVSKLELIKILSFLNLI